MDSKAVFEDFLKPYTRGGVRVLKGEEDGRVEYAIRYTAQEDDTRLTRRFIVGIQDNGLWYVRYPQYGERELESKHYHEIRQYIVETLQEAFDPAYKYHRTCKD